MRLTVLRRRRADPALLPPGAAETGAARLLNDGCAILALAVLGDSGIEHYRGLFFNRAMYVPLAVSAATVAASIHGSQDVTPASERRRDAVYALAAATGLIGTGIHVYNVGKREGGFSLQNLFYGAPLGAPFALLVAGVLGVTGERLREAGAGRDRILGLPMGRVLAGFTAAGLAGTVAEVALLHFRGAFQSRFMYLPLMVPPVAAGLLATAALDPTRRPGRMARVWLWLTTLLGFAGAGFHARGVARMMGGWRNWSQNLLDGPPLPAPPAFTGLGLAGLAALRLLGRERRG